MNWPIIVTRALFALVAIGFSVISIILIYHWHRFAEGKLRVYIFEIVYLIVGAILLLTAAGIVQTL